MLTPAPAPPAASAPSAPSEPPATHAAPPVLEACAVTVKYGEAPAVREVTLGIAERQITAIIGPSGCGKSTLLRSFNRMNDFIAGVSVAGAVRYRGVDLYARDVDPVEVRRRIGMVFQKPNPFPGSIYRNVAWGPSINGLARGRAELDARVERSLRQADLWEDVKDRLSASGLALSGGQQQRLCIARALAMEPEIVLMDEPCSALDPVSTARIEDLLFELKERYTIVIVTHNLQQAGRLSDHTAFMCQGRLVEYGPTKEIFTNPQVRETQDYVTGRFG